MGALVTMSLFGLHSLMNSIRLGLSIGGLMNMWSLDCEKLMQEVNLLMVVLMCLYSFANNRL